MHYYLIFNLNAHLTVKLQGAEGVKVAECKDHPKQQTVHKRGQQGGDECQR